MDLNTCVCVQEQVVDLEEDVTTLSDQFALLDKKMTSVTSIATKFGDRLQVIWIITICA